MEVSGQVVAALLVLFIVVSVVGTWYSMSLAVNVPGNNIKIFGGSKVNLYVPGEPVTSPQDAGVTLLVST